MKGQGVLSKVEFWLVQAEVDKDILNDDEDDCGCNDRFRDDEGDICTQECCSPPSSDSYQTFSIIDKWAQVWLTWKETVARSNFTCFPAWSCLSIWRVNWLMAANLGATLFITERKETIARKAILF